MSESGTDRNIHNPDTSTGGSLYRDLASHCMRLEQENAELKRDYEIAFRERNDAIQASMQDMSKVAQLERIIAESHTQNPYAYWNAKENRHATIKEVEQGYKDNPLFASPVIKEGMQLVPIVPDAKMLLAGKHCIKGMDNGEFESEIARCTYLAMLNASKEG